MAARQVTNTKVTVTNTGDTVVAVDASCTSLAIKNDGASDIYVSTDSPATTSNFPIKAGETWSPEVAELPTYRNETIYGITASGSNTAIHVWQLARS